MKFILLFAILTLFLVLQQECQGVPTTVMKRPLPPGWPHQQQMMPRAYAMMMQQQQQQPQRDMMMYPNNEADDTQDFATPKRQMVRKFLRRNLPLSQGGGREYPGGPQRQGGMMQSQARFFPWLFGYGYEYPPPPPRPEYCVEYFDPLTGFSTEECTPI